jgi:hypothetical protein
LFVLSAVLFSLSVYSSLTFFHRNYLFFGWVRE